MPADLSKSQIDRLGLRLVEAGGPTDGDLDLLRQLLLERSGQLGRAEVRMRDALGVVPTSRVKNTETILEKLRRGDGSGLKSLQDLAGMRIVGDFDWVGQDELVQRIVVLFGDEDRAPKVVDRREEPMHGYRAVHVIAFPEDVPIEIQVRTRWQHEWAEFFEKLADRIGRGIRYGEPADRWDAGPEDGEHVRELLEIRVGMSDALVRWAHAVAGLIAAVEVGEMTTPGDPEVESTRRLVRRDLAEMHEALRDLDGIESSIARWRA